MSVYIKYKYTVSPTEWRRQGSGCRGSEKRDAELYQEYSAATFIRGLSTGWLIFRKGIFVLWPCDRLNTTFSFFFLALFSFSTWWITLNVMKGSNLALTTLRCKPKLRFLRHLWSSYQGAFYLINAASNGRSTLKVYNPKQIDKYSFKFFTPFTKFESYLSFVITVWVYLCPFSSPSLLKF